MNIKDLTALGLSEKEAQVYLSLLELGKDTVQHISNKSGVNRATTYFILDSLLKQGLASTFEQGKKTFYSAEPPEELIKIIEKEEAELKRKNKLFQELLPELKSIYNLAEEKPTVRFFEGKEGLKAMQDHFLLSKATVLHEIYPVDSLESAFTKEELDAQKNQRIERKIESKVLTATAHQDQLAKGHAQADPNRPMIDAETFPITADIGIYDSIVSIASLEGKLYGVMIESKEIADSLRSVFELALIGAETVRKEKMSNQ